MEGQFTSNSQTCTDGRLNLQVILFALATAAPLPRDQPYQVTGCKAETKRAKAGTTVRTSLLQERGVFVLKQEVV